MKKQIKNVFSCLLFFVLILLFQISIVNAQKPSLKDWPTNLDKTAGSGGAGYNTVTSFEDYIGVIIQAALSFLGVIFLALMIFGGYLWMTDRGNSDQVERAKKLISAAIIGLIIVLAAFAISYFVVAKLTAKTLQQ